MKRTIALLLTAVMLLLAVPFASSAAPESKCILFDERGAYAKFADNFVVGTNGTVSFDLAMGTSSEGDPIVKVNGDELQITKNSVVISGSSTPITWGALDTTHWRKVDISYSGNNVTVSLDGVVVASHSGSFTKNILYFLNYPGTILIDNVRVTSAGAEVGFADFDTTANFAQSVVEKTCNRADVPANSYYDYTEVVVPDNVYYIFNSAANAAKLTIQAGVEMYRGDLNEDNSVNVRDLSILRKAIAGDESIIYNKTIADINADTVLNTRDVLALKKVIAGLDQLTKVTIAGAGSGTAAYDQAMDAALLTSSDATADGIDANLIMTAINASDYPYAVITYMTPNKTDDHNSAVATQSAFGAWGNLKDYTLNTDGKFHAEIVDLSDVSTWNGDAATLRFFKAANIGDRIYIDSIVFTANLSKANAAKAEREAAKVGKSIVDVVEPDPTGKIGYLDEDGNYVIRFDTADKITNKVSVVNNTNVSFSDDALLATATGTGDPGYYIDMLDEGVSASDYKYIAYVYKNPNSNKSGKPANIYFVVDGIDVPTRNYETEMFGGTRSSGYSLEIIDLTSNSYWTGGIKGLRIDYFTDTMIGDVSYLDSIILCRSSSLAGKAGNERLKDRNGSDVNGTAEIWNNYWKYYQNRNNYEYITGSPTNLSMYFRYGSASKLTARSLADRMARAITNATGYEVTCKLYSYSFCDLNWNDSNPQAYMYYTIYHEGEAYLVYVKTYIIKDASFTDALDGTSSDPVLGYQNTSTWYSSGYAITNSKASTSFSTYIAAHSNHEIKLVETPYGSFAVHHLTSNGSHEGGDNYTGGGTAGVFRIYDDGTSKQIYSYACTNHTTKPQIMYGDDGLVYFVQADDGEGTSTAEISVGYFDPSQPNSDGTYNITYSRSTRAYPGGPDPSGGGYGYSAPVLDPVSGNIYMFYCGGRDDPGFYLTWFTYNYRQHKWAGGGNTVFYDHYRHCYLYGYPDGAGGVYLVTERACLLECLGLDNVVYGADYAWDQITMFHVKNNGDATAQIVIPADYTQTDREMYPGCMNAYSDVFRSSDNKLHVIWMEGMHARDIHTGINSYMWHCVYDVSTPGAEPVLLYKEPISFASPSNLYTVRFVENTSGHLFILAMPADKNARCEVWRATNALGTEFELVACRNFSNTKSPTTAMMVGNNRNNSVVDNTITCMYPIDTNKFMAFFVTLPAN